MSFEIVLSGLHVNLVPHLHKLYYLGHEVIRHARLDGDIPRMKVHVAFLYPFNAQSTESRQVLGETNRGHDVGKFNGRGKVEDGMGVDIGRVRFNGAAFRADGERQLYPSLEGLIIIAQLVAG